MKQLVWDQSYSVGVRQFDLDHQELARLINAISNLIEKGNHDCEAVNNILGALLDYARGHFYREESTLAKFGYPDLSRQEADHIEFCNVTADACNDALLGVLELNKLHDYLFHWWHTHILKSDSAYREFLKRHGVS